MNKPSSLPIQALLMNQHLRLELLGGEEGLSRMISTEAMQQPGLAMAGYLDSLHHERVQIIGRAEMAYLNTLTEELAISRMRAIFEKDIPCIVISAALPAPLWLVQLSREMAIPILKTSLASVDFMERLKALLSGHLAPRTSIHGVLVEVFGIGVLLTGKSGIGKSELALDLVLRGHRLVADDIVDVRRWSPTSVYGAGPEVIKHHMEIRGLGILNIKDLFGAAAVRDTKKIELVAELAEWNDKEEYDRLGVDELTHKLLEVDVPLVRLPVRPGRNMATIIEVAARNHLLKVRGHFSAREFQARLINMIADGSNPQVPNWDSDVE